MTHIINQSIRYGVFPTRWKVAKVVPIFKSGSSLDVSNYRPISVFPIVSKILEKHVHQALYDYVEKFQLLRVAQSGFRAKHSCETALLKMIDEWLKDIDDGKMIGSNLLDLRKAFDLVNHDILLKKLRLYQCSEQASRWFQSYLSNRKQYVHLNDICSDPKTVISGVPQGSIIGPLLVIIYINEFDICLSHCSADMYADDSTVHVSGRSTDELSVKLSEDLKYIHKWCKDNKMVINADKTKSMLISSKQKQNTLSEETTLNVYLDEHRLENTQQEKLLGIRLDSKLNLTWQEQIDYVYKIVSTRLALLRKIKQLIDLPTRILYFNGHILPFLNYCNLILGSCTRYNLNRIENLIKSEARIILDATYDDRSEELFKRLGWKTFEQNLWQKRLTMTYKSLHDLTPFVYERHVCIYKCCTRPWLNVNFIARFVHARGENRF